MVFLGALLSFGVLCLILLFNVVEAQVSACTNTDGTLLNSAECGCGSIENCGCSYGTTTVSINLDTTKLEFLYGTLPGCLCNCNHLSNCTGMVHASRCHGMSFVSGSNYFHSWHSG